MINYSEYVKLALKGDSDACRVLYEETVDSISFIISRLVSQREDAEDLVQDTYLTAFSHLSQLNQPQAFPKWIHNIAANNAKNYLKKQKPLLFATDEEETEALSSFPAVGADFLPEEYAQNAELRGLLLRAVNALPEKQRIAIYLFYYEDMSVRELCQILEIGENTVKSRLNAGRSGIRSALNTLGITGSALAVLALALRAEAAEYHLPEASRETLWSDIRQDLPRNPGSNSGSSLSGTAPAPAAVKAGFFSTMGCKVAAAVAAAAILAVGALGIAFAKDSPAQPMEPDRLQETNLSSQYTTPEETSKGAEETTEATEAPTETSLTTEPAQPAVTTELLDLGACSFDRIVEKTGSCTESDGFFWFHDGTVGFVFAYGKDMGANYILAPLDKLLSNCPDTLTAQELEQYFPGGKETFDEMDGVYCFCWDYKDCTVVINRNSSGAYGPDSYFYYNCASLVEALLQESESINEEFFSLLGKTKKEIDSILGIEGITDPTYGWTNYSYHGNNLQILTDGPSGICWRLDTNLDSVLVNMTSAQLTAEELAECFGSTYRDPWNGIDTYRTAYRGGQLMISQQESANPGVFGAKAYVTYCLPNFGRPLESGEFCANNSNRENQAIVTVFRLSSAEMVCRIEYSQLTNPYRSAFTETVTLTSTNGITYAADRVTDSWENEMTVTAVLLDGAIEFRFVRTAVGSNANFAIEDFYVYF